MPPCCENGLYVIEHKNSPYPRGLELQKVTNIKIDYDFNALQSY